MGIKSSIYNGVVSHSRLIPKNHSFSYKVYSILFNIDELENIQENCNLFSYNRFNFFSFYFKDHGKKDGSNPKEWILEIASREKIDKDNLEIFCLCYPRVLGYVFNPISVWFIYSNSILKMIIYEVRNTFGEDHSYVFKLDNESQKLNHKSKKTGGKSRYRRTGSFRFPRLCSVFGGTRDRFYFCYSRFNIKNSRGN